MHSLRSTRRTQPGAPFIKALWRPFLALPALALILSCQSSTAPDPTPTPAATSRPLSAQIKTTVTGVPDSLVLYKGSSTTRTRLDTVTGTWRDGRHVVPLQVPTQPTSDTLWMDWWSGGMKIRTFGFAIVSESPTMVADRRNAIGTALIERLDTLAGAHAREPGRRADLMRLLGEALVRGNVDFERWPQDLPAGLTEAQGDSAALAWLVRSGSSLESVRQTWLPRLDREQALAILGDWKASGRISEAQFLALSRPADTSTKDTTAPTIRILSPQQETTVSNESSSVLVEALVSDASGIALVEVNGAKLTTSPWKLRVDLAVGSNSISVIAQDSAGNRDTVSVSVLRQALGDKTPPVIDRLTPSDDSTVPWTTRSIVARWKVTDDSLLTKVSLGGAALTGADGLFERNQPLDTGKNTFILTALDLRGNPASDTFSIRRSPDAESPVLSRVYPSTDTVVPSTQDSLKVAWTAKDNDSLLEVVIENIVRKGEDGRFEAMVPLTGDSMWIRVQARDRTDNTARDSIKVFRVAAPTIAPTSRGLKAAQIVTITPQRGASAEFSLDNGTTWTPYTQELEVATNTRLMARSRRGSAVSPLARADYAFAPTFRPEYGSFRRFDSISEFARLDGAFQPNLTGKN